jgi:hypothetical protein
VPQLGKPTGLQLARIADYEKRGDGNGIRPAELQSTLFDLSQSEFCATAGRMCANPQKEHALRSSFIAATIVVFNETAPGFTPSALLRYFQPEGVNDYECI